MQKSLFFCARTTKKAFVHSLRLTSSSINQSAIDISMPAMHTAERFYILLQIYLYCINDVQFSSPFRTQNKPFRLLPPRHSINNILLPFFSVNKKRFFMFFDAPYRRNSFKKIFFSSLRVQFSSKKLTFRLLKNGVSLK
jgi:hypothetical protein